MHCLLSILASLACPLLTQATEKIAVSTFSTVLTEIAEQVGGSRVLVTGHVKPGMDPHQFEPKASDLKTVSEAQLILLSSKHMESYIDNLQESTGTKAMVVQIGSNLAPLRMKDPHDSAPNVEDPHWWHSIAQTEKATRLVAEALARISPADEATFSTNAAKYTAKLEALAKWARQQIAQLPRDQRKLITSHDAFQYFARDYGFTVYAVEGLSSAEQPSPRHVAEIIGLIKAQRVKAIFAENLNNPKVLQEITRETGVKLGGKLYADGLGEGEAATYEGMYRHNVSTIVEALK
jgi:ABC-type Zn uptake system ZnuABC Zn-binding protein ZnuA